jgi:AcrR family transcriptional regulator
VSARQEELLDRAYAYVLAHGIADLSLRPLAAAIGSSPRVLLFLFGSKDGLIRALLARSRQEQLVLVKNLRSQRPDDVAMAIWDWAADPRHRPLLTLWLEAYTRSVTDPTGPWSGFATQSITDWLTALAEAQPDADPTETLVILRGGLLDLLATDDSDRISAAVRRAIRGAGEGNR